MRLLGSLDLDSHAGVWNLDVEPHVGMMAKRVFGKLPKIGSKFVMQHTPANCFELAWFAQRYPLQVNPQSALDAGAAAHRERIQRLDELVDPHYKPQQFDLAVPAREYQLRAAEMWLKAGGLLLADDVGLGKTCSAIAAMTSMDVRPVCVTCLAHLPKQWEREINRFAPDLFVHILKKGTPYELPREFNRGPDVIITSYHKLAGWCDALASYCKSIVFDEIQELRHSDSRKYAAAKRITSAVQYRLGLSATPIYNYGAEMLNVMEQLAPGSLGSHDEFQREWCSDKLITDPDAFGSHLREQHLMLRRTRKDVGRELPRLQKVTVPVDSDSKALKAIEGRAGELARLLLSEDDLQRGEAMQAAAEFDVVMRQATGLAKAPYVAAFVEMLLAQDIPVVLYGWHHAVYDVWMEQLREYKPELYTGRQSATQKQAAVDRFVNGDTNLLIISVRAGAGLDGLQKRCATTVHGELDWSPGIIEQDIGRVYRDGQEEPVMAYILLSESGTDPLMAEVLGIKQDQSDGILANRSSVLQRVDTGNTLKKLAKQYLQHHQQREMVTQ